MIYIEFIVRIQTQRSIIIRLQCPQPHVVVSMGVSHVVLTMDPNGDLIIYKNRGRPNAEEREIIQNPIVAKEELEKLKKEMGYEDGAETVLSFSIASDEMIRHVHMFPEVFFLDVTANTNRQKRDLFVMVVRDATGQCYIGNLTILPSGQAWIFQHIFEKFFKYLYGDITLSRNRLCLTDDDSSLYGPLDNLIQTRTEWSNSRHMLCIFHAIVQPFHKQIYPLLPAVQQGNKRKITNTGREYCEFILFCYVSILRTH